MKNTEKTKSNKSRLQLLHQYYRYTGFYNFVGKSVLKALPFIGAVVLGVVIINRYFNLNEALLRLTEALPVTGVLMFFFASETLLGLVPPEIFIAWAGKLNMPWFYLFLLAILSYTGGLITYWIGKAITSIPKVHNYFELKMKKQLKHSKKWGGLLIVVGAVLPLPFSLACMAAGMISFPFRSVAIFGTLRFARYVAYGLIIFNVV